jgi:hypothetical protein
MNTPIAHRYRVTSAGKQLKYGNVRSWCVHFAEAVGRNNPEAIPVLEIWSDDAQAWHYAQHFCQRFRARLQWQDDDTGAKVFVVDDRVEGRVVARELPSLAAAQAIATQQNDRHAVLADVKPQGGKG